MKRMIFWLLGHAVVLALILFFLIGFVPVFLDMYKDFGVTLPASTRHIAALSSFLRRYMLLFMSPALLLFFGLDGWAGWQLGRRAGRRAATAWWAAILTTLVVILVLLVVMLWQPMGGLSEAGMRP